VAKANRTPWLTLGALFLSLSFGCSSSNSGTQSGDGGEPDSGNAGSDQAGGSSGTTHESGGAGASSAGGKGNGGATPSTGGSAGDADAGSAGSGGAPSSGGSGSGGRASTGGRSSTGGAAGTPAGAWSNATGNLSGMDSECGNVQVVTAKPDEDMILTGIAQQGVWASTDGGATYKKLGGGQGSSTITNRTTMFLFDPAHPKAFWESGLYNGGGVYATTDDGVTLKATGTVTHTDAISVDFSDPDRKTLLAGGHEMSQTLNLSLDSGATWKPIGSGLPDKTNCTHPLILDTATYLVGCGGYGGGVTGIYQSTDGGKTWKSLTTAGGYAAPLVAKDGTIYWPSAGNGALARSTDGGKTFTKVGGDNTYIGVTPVELPDGRIAVAGFQKVLVSNDRGNTWTAATTDMPYQPTGLAYSAQRKAFFVCHFTCGNGNNPVPPDAIVKYAFE
jgi:hypothetical protein